MDKEQVGRRNMLARAGLALGGLVTLGSLPGCGEETSTAPPPVTPTVADFPYDQHIIAAYQLDAAAVQEAAYHAYYAGGCCHGTFSALVAHLAATAGPPFDLLPINFGKFGAGGIDGYGSICGSLLGAELVINMIVSDPTARKNMIWELMRWYETAALPSYVPTAVDALETGLTKDFSAGNLANLQVAPTSHLCHASVSRWCAAQSVSAGSADKKARCARLTADVAGKAVALLNTYLGARTYSTIGAADPNGRCDTCHTAGSAANPSVASDMTCVSCHPIANLPGTHPTVTP
jgi:hypothetical protein